MANDQPPPPPPETTSTTLAKTARGAGWVIGWRWATRGIGFFSTLILVRLLTPSDFGLVTLATSLIQGLDGVVGFGVEGAIIRTERVDHVIYNAGFTINVLRSTTTSAVLALAAVPLAHFFGNSHLTNVIYVLAASWAFSGFQNIGMVEYRRTLAFDMEFKLNIIPRLLALFVTIPAAIIWHSYWALIGGIVASTMLTVIVSYWLHPYRPGFGIAGMKHIFSFSFWEWLIGLMNLIGGRADTIIIGRLLGTAQVGVYGVGGEIAALPNGEIVAPLCRALFSGFVAEIREGGNGAGTLLRILSMLALLTFPLSVGLSLVAFPITKLCFGPAWLQAVPVMQILAISSMITLFGSVGEALFSAHAWLRTILGVVSFVTVLRVTLLLIMIPRYGLLGGALAVSAIGLVQESLYMVILQRRLHVSLWPVLVSVARPATAAALMAATLTLSGLGWGSHDGSNFNVGLGLALSVSMGAVVYIGALGALWLAAGRPAGAETDLYAMAKRMLARG